MTEQSLTGRNIAVRGYEPPDVGIVVSGVEVVPAGLDVEVIAAVAERVDVGDVGFIVRNIVTAAVGDLPVIPPRVVLVLRHKCSGSVAYTHNVPLQVLVVPVLCFYILIRLLTFVYCKYTIRLFCYMLSFKEYYHFTFSPFCDILATTVLGQ